MPYKISYLTTKMFSMASQLRKKKTSLGAGGGDFLVDMIQGTDCLVGLAIAGPPTRQKRGAKLRCQKITTAKDSNRSFKGRICKNSGGGGVVGGPVSSKPVISGLKNFSHFLNFLILESPHKQGSLAHW